MFRDFVKAHLQYWNTRTMYKLLVINDHVYYKTFTIFHLFVVLLFGFKTSYLDNKIKHKDRIIFMPLETNNRTEIK